MNCRQADAFAHDQRVTICEVNFHDKTVASPRRSPKLFIELQADQIESADTVVSVIIARHDGKYARVNLTLSARHDGNAIKATVNTVGLTKAVDKTLSAQFVWLRDEHGDFQYPEGHPNS